MYKMQLKNRYNSFKNWLNFGFVSFAMLALCACFMYAAIASNMHTVTRSMFAVLSVFVLFMYFKNYKKIKKEHTNV